jgi:hypothetical protein
MVLKSRDICVIMRRPMTEKVKVNSPQSGLSVIEIVAVVTIIGLFVSVVLGVRKIVDFARQQRIIQQIESYITAVQVFEDRFNALPGDFHNANEAFGEKIDNGDGDGAIGGKPFTSGNDAALFWIHLRAAGLVKSLNKKSKSGIEYPGSSLGGGFTVENSPTEEMNGPYLVIGNEGDSDGRSGALTPAQAKYIDEKLDNGDPMSGNIQVRDGSNFNGDCVKDGKYNTSSNKKSCTVYILLRP